MILKIIQRLVSTKNYEKELNFQITFVRFRIKMIVSHRVGQCLAPAANSLSTDVRCDVTELLA